MREDEMAETVDQDASSRLAEQALMAMQARGITPTPENFAIWYQHQTGGNPTLLQEIALIDESPEGFSPERSAELYRRFGRGNDHHRQLKQVSDRVGGVIEDVAGKLGLATSQTRDYTARLSSLGEGLSAIIDPGELVALVCELEHQTDLMRQRALKLEAALDRNSREISDLKDDLANAQLAATTDPLTRLGNRKLFDDVFAEEVANAEISGEPLALLVTDIDHFKAFNDRHGHQIGDVVLKVVAEKLKRSVKGRDTVARYGGEEFAILLPRTDLDAATHLADQLRSEIAKSRLVVRNRGQDLGKVTLSIGVAGLQAGETVDNCFRRADEALYRAKRNGRNQVAVAHTELERVVA